MSAIPHLVGMVHLLPLPGSPLFSGSMTDVLDAARSDATELAKAGFPALMIENFGDGPFFADAVPAETIAAMSIAVEAILHQSGLPIGVNVLRNDVLAALGIAAATGAGFVRVNVLTGMMHTDQGPITGRAAEALRKRAMIAPRVEIWADVMVKHATPPPGLELRHAALDTVDRGHADAVIVSGHGTGSEPDPEEVRLVSEAVPKETRVVIGSGTTPANVARLHEVADTVIVGSFTKRDGDARNRVDPGRAAHLIDAARACGLL